ncbi:hypothetical protein QBC37DRAFT_433106 [Rhypophila decipiens]|uniref:Uncharacterized protein n=1 Tax=Rhypophila decipiens TaxID=261697 RepID=A0AAN7B2M4_9PEZI|nr:hypothetical protein QBC37DRAFT_433106 [Rhypophila decipiens]
MFNTRTLSLLLGGAALLATASPAPNPSTSPLADCALVDCASGLKCAIINNAAACVAPGSRQGPQCGYNPQNRCPAGETCCNPSCGICTKPGMGCIKLLCQPPKQPIITPRVPPTISPGGKCGNSICAANEYCCNDSCGYCRKANEPCTLELCATPKPPIVPPKPPQLGPKCGPNVCAAGETCCNESCGYCAKPGGKGCTKELCHLGPSCGRGTMRCAYGEECCNDSCGICTKPGMGCIMKFCPPAN